MTEEEKKVTTREKHPGRVAQVHKLAPIMKKRKEEILRSKEQPTEQSAVQCTIQSTVQSTEQSTVQPTVQPTEQPPVQSNGAYIYDVGILTVLAIGDCVLFTYNKKAGWIINEEPIKPKRRHML